MESREGARSAPLGSVLNVLGPAIRLSRAARALKLLKWQPTASAVNRAVEVNRRRSIRQHGGHVRGAQGALRDAPRVERGHAANLGSRGSAQQRRPADAPRSQHRPTRARNAQKRRRRSRAAQQRTRQRRWRSAHSTSWSQQRAAATRRAAHQTKIQKKKGKEANAKATQQGKPTLRQPTRKKPMLRQPKSSIAEQPRSPRARDASVGALGLI